MFEFLKRKKKGSGVIALDIGADRVKSVFFAVEEKLNQAGDVTGKRALIQGMGEVAQEGGESPEGMITDIASVIENCKRSIRLASEQAGRSPAQLLLGVSGESIKGGTTIEVFDREDPKSKINLAELHNILHKLEWRSFAETRKQVSEEMGYPEIDCKLMHAAVVDIKIDGYKVANPLGFQGSQVQISLFNSFAPLPYYGALNNIAEELKLELLGIIPESYALSRSLEAEDPALSAIFIDIGGNATSIAVVTNGTLRGSKLFGVGGRTFTKRLAVELNLAHKEAEKLKLAYAADKLEPKSKKIIADLIQNDIEVWLEGIVLALSEFKQVEELPGKILLTGGGSQLPEFREALNHRKWHKKLHFSAKPQASFIKITDMPLLIDDAKRIKAQTNIVPAALVNLGIELTGEESIVQKTLRKVIGIMQV
ncbi:MAG: cell division FtsA domain-containing protein [Candidatus Peregrinibacteria bacterium]